MVAGAGDNLKAHLGWEAWLAPSDDGDLVLAMD